MVIYHEVSPDSLGAVKLYGLKCTSRGAKSNDPFILKADTLLDKHRSPHIRKANVSRNHSIYGYLGTESSIVDIQNGQQLSISEKIRQTNHVLLRLNIGLEACWISDLDRYDTVKDAIKSQESHEKLLKLCENYWRSVRPIAKPNLPIQRPEVMITQDIGPSAILEVNS